MSPPRLPVRRGPGEDAMDLRASSNARSTDLARYATGGASLTESFRGGIGMGMGMGTGVGMGMGLGESLAECPSLMDVHFDHSMPMPTY